MKLEITTFRIKLINVSANEERRFGGEITISLMIICDHLQDNQAQRGHLQIFFCTYGVVGIQILSSPSFILIA